MTLEERIARIENALIAGGLLTPAPGPTYEDAIADLLKGDKSTLIQYFTKHPPHLKVSQGRCSAGSVKPLPKGVIPGMPRTKKAADMD